MKSYDTDPGSVPFSGEPANYSVGGLAAQLLEHEPYELVRSYTRFLEDAASVEFHVTEEVNDGDVTTLAGVRIFGEEEDPCFELVLNSSNTLITWQSPSSEHMVVAAELAKSMLDAAALDPKECAILEHVRNLIYLYLQQGQILPAAANMVKTGQWNRESMSSMIRFLVKEADPTVMQVKEFSYAIDAQHALTIIEQTIVGTTDRIDMFEFSDEPMLQVEYEDRDARMNHCYVETMGGHKSYEQYDPADLLAKQMTGHEETGPADDMAETRLPKAGMELLRMVMTNVLIEKIVPDTFSVADFEAAKPN